MSTKSKIQKLIHKYDCRDWKRESQKWIDVLVLWLTANDFKIRRNYFIIGNKQELKDHPKIQKLLKVNRLRMDWDGICWSHTNVIATVSEFDNMLKRKFVLNHFIEGRRDFTNHPVLVLLHEIGHWIFDRWLFSGKIRQQVTRWKKVIALIGDPRIQSGHCAKFFEDTANAFAEYTLRPRFMRESRPEWYELFNSVIGIQPLF